MMRRRKKTNRRRLNRRLQKKTRSRQRERGARVKGVTRTTPAKAFDATQAHVNAFNKCGKSFEFFQNFLVNYLGCPTLTRLEGWGEGGEDFFRTRRRDLLKRFACSVLGPSVTYILRLIYSLEDILFFALWEVFFSRALEELLFCPSVNTKVYDE